MLIVKGHQQWKGETTASCFCNLTIVQLRVNLASEEQEIPVDNVDVGTFRQSQA